MKTLFFIIASMHVSCAPLSVCAQTLMEKATMKYRDSTVFLKVKKVTNTGTIIEEYGSGFVISDKGHILTSCHVVNDAAYDVDGKKLPVKIDKVEVTGTVASKYASLEPIKVLQCGSDGFDLALLKFKNTSKQRWPIPAVAHYSIGDRIITLGYPAGTDFFIRSGAIGGDTDDDLNTVDITLNPGDSGGPVLNKSLDVVALVEGGMPNTPSIGIVRPIRHAAMLFAVAGVSMASTGIDFSGALDEPKAQGNKVLFANAKLAMAEFLRGRAWDKDDSSLQTVEVSYPVAAELTSGASTSQAVNIALAEVRAKPGYTIKDAQFIVTNSDGAEVATVVPVSNGTVARAAIIPTNNGLSGKKAFVTGFIKTFQERQ